jgi:hypothetical protein
MTLDHFALSSDKKTTELNVNLSEFAPFVQRIHGLRCSYLRRINDSGLEGVTTDLALPKMAYARCSEIF